MCTTNANDPDHYDVFPGGCAAREVRDTRRQAARVIAFMNSHDVASGRAIVLAASIDGTTITVRGEEHHDETGWRDFEETIPATMQAARDWLGY